MAEPIIVELPMEDRELIEAERAFTAAVKAILAKRARRPAQIKIDALEKQLEELLRRFLAAEGRKVASQVVAAVEKRRLGASKTLEAATITKTEDAAYTTGLGRAGEADSEREWFEQAIRNWPSPKPEETRAESASYLRLGSHAARDSNDLNCPDLGSEGANGLEGSNPGSDRDGVVDTMLNDSGLFDSSVKKHDRLPVTHITFQGFPISIENPAGTYRVWGKTKEELEDGKGRTLMLLPYGYFLRSMGEDGDHVDCYVGPNENAREVYVVRQLNPWTGQPDEDKCFLGLDSVHEAREMFLAHWDPVLGPKAFGGITAYPVEEFRRKVHETMKRPGAIKIAFNYLAEKAFNEDQPRDEHGRWTDEGSSDD